MGRDKGGNGGGSSDKERADHYYRTGEYTPKGDTVGNNRGPRRKDPTPGYDPGGPTNQLQLRSGEILDSDIPVNKEYSQMDPTNSLKAGLYFASGGMIGDTGRLFQPINRGPNTDMPVAGKDRDRKTGGAGAAGMAGTSGTPTQENTTPEGGEVQLEGVADTETVDTETGPQNIGMLDMNLTNPMLETITQIKRPALFMGGPNYG